MQRNYWLRHAAEDAKSLRGGAKIASVALTMLIVGSALVFAL